MILDAPVLQNPSFVFDLPDPVTTINDIEYGTITRPSEKPTTTFSKILLTELQMGQSFTFTIPDPSVQTVHLTCDLVRLDVDKNKRVIPYKAFCFIMKL